MRIPGQGFMCDACQYTGHNRTLILRHINTKHIRNQCFICHVCKKRFYSENSRQVHMKKLHNLTLSWKQLRTMDQERRGRGQH